MHSEGAKELYPKRTAFDILMTELQATNMVSEENKYESDVVYTQYEQKA